MTRWPLLSSSTFLPVICILAACVVFAGYFSIVGWRQHTNITTNRFDLGNMSQVVWNTSQGRIMQFTDPYGTETVSRFAYHADPILIFFAPLYWLWADPRMLIMAQAAIVALGGWILFLIGRSVLQRSWIAALIAGAFLMYPTLQHAVLFDFHPLTIAATFALVMAYGVVAKKRWIFICGALLLMLCKEELSLIVITVALWQAIKSRSWTGRWTIMAVVATVYFIVIVFLAMPFAGKNISSGYGAIHSDEARKTSTQIVADAGRHPQQIIDRLADAKTRQLALGLAVPTAGIALASPWWILAGWPELALPLIDTRESTLTLIYHYHAVTSALMFVSVVFGFVAIRRRMQESHYAALQRLPTIGMLAALLLIGTAIGVIRYSPLPFSYMSNTHGLQRSSRAPFIWDTMHAIPKNASVSATNTLGAQVSERENLYFFPNGIDQAEYIAILLAKPGTTEWLGNHAEAESLASDSRFEKIVERSNFSLYKRIQN